MAVSFIGAGSITDDLVGAASFTVTAPTCAINDIVIVALWNEGGSKPTLGTPSGVAAWNEITTGAGTADATWYWGRANATGTPTGVASAADTDCFGIAAVYRGCYVAGTPIVDATTSGDGTNTDTTPDTALITTTGANQMAVAILNHGDDIAFASGNPPATWTNDATVLTGDGTDAGFTFMSKQVAAAGDVASVVFGTWSAGEAYWAVTFALIPELSPTVALNTPTDTATGVSTTPDLVFTGTDLNADEIEYNVQVDDASDFNPVSNDSQTSDAAQYSVQGGTATSGELNQACGQTITPTYSFDLTSIDLKLWKVNSPTDNVSVSVHTTSETGTNLGTSSTIAASSLGASPGTVKNFTFSPAIRLSAGVTYYFVVERSGARDTTNEIDVRRSTTSGYAGGNGRFRSSNSWFSDANYDLYFVLYPTTFTAPLLNKFSVTPDATFSGTGDPHPWPSGNQITYTVQAGDILTANTQYWWRVAGIDPSGSNTYGAWPTAFSFTTAAAGGGTPPKATAYMTTNTGFWGI